MKKVLGLMLLGIFSWSILSVSFIPAVKAQEKASGKQELMSQLDKLREDFIAQRDALHDQNRILRIQWHKERAALYQELKKSGADKKALQKKINDGFQNFYANKKEIYNKLAQLRKDWLNKRAQIYSQLQKLN